MAESREDRTAGAPAIDAREEGKESIVVGDRANNDASLEERQTDRSKKPFISSPPLALDKNTETHVAVGISSKMQHVHLVGSWRRQTIDISLSLSPTPLALSPSPVHSLGRLFQ